MQPESKSKDCASDTVVISKPRKRGWNYGLFAAGIISGLMGFYTVEGLATSLFFGFGGLCFAASRYLSYMENAGPN